MAELVDFVRIRGISSGGKGFGMLALKQRLRIFVRFLEDGVIGSVLA